MTVRCHQERSLEPLPTEMLRLAGVIFSKGDDVDALLSDLAGQLTRDDVRVAGFVQESASCKNVSCCPATFVRNLSDNSATCISVDLGPRARGCRLDPSALGAAIQRVEQGLEHNADIVVLNRFGQSESEGRGARPTIELGATLGLPVIIGVREPYLAAWEAFHGGIALNMPMNFDDVLAWARGSLATKVNKAAA